MSHKLRSYCRLFLLAVALTVGAAPRADSTQKATFAGGCFWCMEPPYDALPGVTRTTSGYIGGHVAQPTYEQVTAGGTGHVEAVEVEYDPRRVTYEKLLEVYWRNVDPFDGGGQFCDRGASYRPVIFVHDAGQRAQAERSKREIASRFERALAVEIRPATDFYPAEDYHQDYYRKNRWRYKYYRYSCRRDDRLKEIWGKDAG